MVFNICCMCDDKSTSCTYSCNSKKLCPSLALFFLFVFIPYINTIQQDSAEFVTLTTQQKNCYEQSNGEVQCELKGAKPLALMPYEGQESVLIIKTQNGSLLGNLSIIVEKISLACKPKNEYYTRSFKMYVSSSKRCPTAGSCKGDKCETIDHNSTIAEFAGIANDSPGFTYCAESCGCWGCGCLLCGSGCLFYRTFAQPITEAVYEVFSCPTWKYKVKLTIAINLEHENMQQMLDVETEKQQSWRNITVGLMSISDLPSPILGSHFMTDGVKTIMFGESVSGHSISDKVEELQCASAKKAANFHCNLKHDPCICQTKQTRASCQCPSHNLEKMFEDTEHLVPFKSEGVSIVGTGKNIEAEYKQIASLQVQIGMEKLQLATIVQKNLCVIENLYFVGDYSALTGAILQFICKTDFGQATAYVKCGVSSFITKCTNNGYTGNATLNFHNGFVHENCTVTCPGGSTNFAIHAKLGQKARNLKFDIDDVNSPPIKIGENSRNGWGKWIGYTAATVGGIVVILVAVKYLCCVFQKMSANTKHLLDTKVEAKDVEADILQNNENELIVVDDVDVENENEL